MENSTLSGRAVLSSPMDAQRRDHIIRSFTAIGKNTPSCAEYLRRIAYATVNLGNGKTASIFYEKSTLVLAYIYVSKFLSYMELEASEYNSHYIFLIALDIARKFNEDECFMQRYYAKVAGIEPIHMLRLTQLFLEAVKYEVWYSPKEVENVQAAVNDFVNNPTGGKIGIKRY